MEFTMRLNKPLCVLCWLVSIPLALALIALTARGQEQLPAGLNVASMEVRPAAVELKHRFEYRQLLVTGKLSSGESVDLTRMVKVSHSGKAANVSADGQVRAAEDGTDEITYTYGNQSVKVPVTVSGVKSPHPVSFVRDVQPLMARMSCNAGTCHGAKDGKAGFKLSLRGYDAIYDIGR